MRLANLRNSSYVQHYYDESETQVQVVEIWLRNACSTVPPHPTPRGLLVYIKFGAASFYHHLCCMSSPIGETKPYSALPCPTPIKKGEAETNEQLIRGYV